MCALHTGFVAAVAVISVLIYSCCELPVVKDFVRSYVSGLNARAAADGPWPPNPRGELPPSSSKLYQYNSAAVCSDSAACSSIGSALLQQGGSAVDSAIGTMLCNGLLAMQSMGLGGGALLNVYSRRERRAYSVLAREVAPLRPLNMRNMTDFFTSNAAIAVPTEVAGYAAAHRRFGKLPWATLVQPTAALCRIGYGLTQHQRDALDTNRARVLHDVLLREMFVLPNTTSDFRPAGSRIMPPKELCHTYDLLAEQGPSSFYEGGQLARMLAADLHDLDTAIDRRDLRALRVAVVPSLAVDFGEEYRLHLTPPPGSGHIVAFVANLLLDFETDFRAARHMGSLELHRIVEALKFGFVKRWQLDVNAQPELLYNLSCPKYAKEWAALIDDSMTSDDPRHYGAVTKLLQRLDHGTAHISVLAPNGDAVAATSSINYYFGSGSTGPRTGILFNNALADFTIRGFSNYFKLPDYGAANRLKPGQSPMSSMSPLIVTNKRNGVVRLVSGAAGGTRIISVLAQILVRTLWLGEDIKKAIDAPRVHQQMQPNVLEYEFGTVQQLVTELNSRGHKTLRNKLRRSAVCGIEKKDGTGLKSVRANADFRKEGDVAGF